MIKIENDMLNIMIEKPLVENNICNKCKIYEAEIKDSSNVWQAFTSSIQKLKNMLENQKNFQNQNGWGFKQYNQRKVNTKQFDYINCFYSNQKGHHIRNCSYRNGTYVLKQ